MSYDFCFIYMLYIFQILFFFVTYYIIEGARQRVVNADRHFGQVTEQDIENQGKIQQKWIKEMVNLFFIIDIFSKRITF